MDKEEIRQMIKEELAAFFADPLGLTISTRLNILDGRNLRLGTRNGTTIGTETSQKLAFYGAVPVTQRSAISAPIGGGSSATDAVDQSARARINDIRQALKDLGLTA